jgi:hypothetical protein
MHEYVPLMQILDRAFREPQGRVTKYLKADEGDKCRTKDRNVPTILTPLNCINKPASPYFSLPYILYFIGSGKITE